MTAIIPAYRLTIYAPRSVDATETTVLTPAAGAPHSEFFKISSIPGVTGFQPYLDAPRGRRGRIDLLDRRLDIGVLTFSLIDRKVGTTGGNLQRWWTAFFGDTGGKPRGRMKVLVEESLDNGTTWSTFMIGRLQGTRASGRARMELTVHDEADSLRNRIFVGPPHSSITYAAMQSLMPVGILGSDYGTLVKTTPMIGTATSQFVAGVAFHSTDVRVVVLRSDQLARVDNIVTENLVQSVAPNIVIPGQSGETIQVTWTLPNFAGPCRARLKHLTGAYAGQTGNYKVGWLQFMPFGNPQHARLSGFMIAALDSTDVGYLPVPANNDMFEFTLFADTKISESNPLLLNDVDPATLLQDLCDGKFGYLYRTPEIRPGGKNNGDVKQTIATNSFAAFVGTQPPFRGRITKADELIDWVEKNLLKQYHWAIYLDRLGKLTLVDLRLPTSLTNVPTITDTDLAVTIAPDWEHDPKAAITRVEFTRYFDAVAIDDLYADPEYFPQLTSGGIIQAFEHEMIILDLGSTDFGDQPYEVDAIGYRSMSGEQLQTQSRSTYLENRLIELANQLRRPFGYGRTTIRLPCRRTATVTALAQGGLVFVAMTHVPDPTTKSRGGVRLCRVLEISEDGPIANLELIDLAVNSLASPPTLGAPALGVEDGFTSVTTLVTLNAFGQAAEVRYAVTDTATGTAPADTSPLWSIAALTRATAVVSIRDVPPGKRIWIQGRTFPEYGVGTQQLPSAWVAAASPGRVDTTALPAPTTPTVPTKTNVTATLAWVNTATDLLIEILLATPVGDPRVRVGVVLPGSTRFELRDLVPSTSYRAEIRYLFGAHVSAGITVDFTTNASGTAAPAIAGIEIIT